MTKKPDLDNLSPLTKQTQNKDTPRPDNVTARSSGQNTLEWRIVDVISPAAVAIVGFKSNQDIVHEKIRTIVKNKSIETTKDQNE